MNYLCAHFIVYMKFSALIFENMDIFHTLNIKFLYNTNEDLNMAFVDIDYQMQNREFCISSVKMSVQFPT